MSHAFGGLASETINGQDATVFNSGITAAGGSATWAASTDFKADGTVTGADSDAARLNLGTYINASMGTATGKFSLTATLNPISGGGADFLSLGYFTGPIDLGEDFASDTNKYAVATAVTRVSSDGISDYFKGPGAANSIDHVEGRGLRTYTLDFDFTPEGGYDGVSNFGTMTFHSDNDSGSVSRVLNSAQNIQYIGITRDDSVQGAFSNFQLTQIPEPGSFVLVFVGGLFLVARRRR
ncbi:PEP-CTERM sorting domain-containing protein [Kiritimatiellota bacterium B12222]|nr:PEP-CTERM sorting domain-containing protein [Kiritimatiellota bacterium B12222]